MADEVERAYREHWGRLLALLVRDLRSFDLAEDSLQDAFAAAVRHWRREGAPANPPAWLLTSARRRALDRLRREATLQRKLPLLITGEAEEPEWPEEADEPPGIPDERLRLIFTCCHPALSMDARVALTLRCVAGLKTPEIARMFLVSQATMAARITRAKKKIAASGLPYRVPSAADMPERISGVLAVIYLVFTEGYAATAGERLIREELCAEAIRLGRVLTGLLPGEPEASALLALMLFQHARRAARLDADGVLVRLRDQDRRLWHWDEIDEAKAVLSDRSFEGGGRGLWDGLSRASGSGPYRLQAEIAAEHVREEGPDWFRIARLYDALEGINGSPVVRLNRAVAVAEAVGAEAGLALLDGMGETAGGRRHILPATRAELLSRLGRHEEAVAQFRRALGLVESEGERAFLERRLADLP